MADDSGLPARFVYEDWADEAADGTPPPWSRSLSQYRQIRAFKRYLVAKHGGRTDG